MKGPGLPGFRKQVGRGFYKSPGFDINTSNRSPMKQGEEEDGYKQAEQDAIDEARKEYLKYIEEGGDPNKVNWDNKVVEVRQDVKNRMKIGKSLWKKIQTGTLKKFSGDKLTLKKKLQIQIQSGLTQVLVET